MDQLDVTISWKVHASNPTQEISWLCSMFVFEIHNLNNLLIKYHKYVVSNFEKVHIRSLRIIFAHCIIIKKNLIFSPVLPKLIYIYIWPKNKLIYCKKIVSTTNCKLFWLFIQRFMSLIPHERYVGQIPVMYLNWII